MKMLKKIINQFRRRRYSKGLISYRDGRWVIANIKFDGVGITCAGGLTLTDCALSGNSTGNGVGINKEGDYLIIKPQPTETRKD